MVNSSGQFKQLKQVEAANSNIPKEEEEAPLGSEAHLWLFNIPVAVDGDNKGKKFEGTCYFDKIPKAWKEEWKDKEIRREDWRIPDPAKPDADFRPFVNSHIPRFDKLKADKRFYLYCEQARRWLENAVDIADVPQSERYDWKKEEFRRVRQNKLYGLNRYISIKEDNKAAGRRKFVASTPQALLAFLVDSGVSFDLVKGRQAAITSTMMAIAALEAVVRNSYSGVFIVHKKDGTGKKLFRDKFKSTLQHLPSWMRVGFDEDGWSAERVYLDFDKGDKKGDKGRDASEFLLLSAEDSMVVNGQTPTQSFFDEAQNIPTYQAIKGEIDPTMYQFNERTGRMELVRSVYAWGCVCAGTKVWTKDGRMVKIEDLKQEDGIMGWSHIRGTAPQDIAYMQPPSEKPCYRITTNTGRFLECSDDHPILWGKHNWTGRTYRESEIGGRFSNGILKNAKFVDAKDIQIGDQVAIADEVPFFGEKRMWEPRLVGWLIGDGYYGGCSVRLSNCDPEINDYVYKNFDAKEEKGHITKDGKEYKETRLNGIQDRMRELGIFGQTKQAKRLPDNVHDYCKEDLCELLGGLFDTDGHVNVSGARTNRFISLTSSVYELLDEVRMVLQKLGIESNISRIKCNPLTNPRDKNDWFSLVVGRKDAVLRFNETIKFSVSHKQEKLEIAADWHSKIREKKLKNPHGTKFERVVNVEYIGIREIYNLTATDDHTYIANGIITHNTGSSNSVGKGSFESDFKGLLEAWQTGEQTDGWVPVFMDWTCRPGMTREHYMRMRNKYLRGQTEETKGLSKSERLSLFLAHYPSQPDDAFMTTHKTLLPMELIMEYQKKCVDSPIKPIPGRFVPLFDESKTVPPGGMFPHPIRGVMWEEAPADDDNSPIMMMFPPEQGWTNRYFQGTDPIQNDGGFSRFSSAIWDAVGIEHGEGDQKQFLPAVACILNHRTAFPQDLFAQCALMGMYYANHGQRACKEVVEINAGGRYVDAKCGPEFNLKDSLVFRGALPPAYRGGTHWFGVDLKGGKGSRKEALYHDTTNLLRTNGKRIFYYGFWSQVRNISVESKPDGSVQWGTMNKNAFNDDMVYAVAYAELGCRAINQQPMRIDNKQTAMRSKRVLKRDKNLMPYYENVLVPVTYR